MADDLRSVASSITPGMRGSAAGAAPRQQSGFSLFLLLIAVTALNSVAVNLLVPALPHIAGDLGSDYATIQLATSGFLVANAIGFLCLGSISDHIGRRPALLCGLLLYAAASAICAAAGSTEVLLVARFVEGVGASSGVVLAQTIIRDRYDHRRSASVIAYMALGYGAAPMFAPLVGGAIDDVLGWRANFVLLTLAALLAAAAAYWTLAETMWRRAATRPLASLQVLARQPAFWASTLTYTCSLALFYCFLTGTSYAARFVLDIDGTAYGVYFVIVNLGFGAAALITGRFVGRVGPAPFMVAGAGIAVLATAGMTATFAVGNNSALDYFVPMLIINFGNGLMQPNAIASVASVRPELAGTATGLAGALQVLFGAAATTVVGTILGVTGSQVGFALTATAFAAGALAASLWARTLKIGEARI
jgi:DHA1 family bicyclomycin/chloramphenicol resistance-like MFS transporter